MRKTIFHMLMICTLFALSAQTKTYADASDPMEESIPTTEQPAPIPEPEAPPQTETPSKKVKMSAFTGKITKNKVRMRLQPNYESTVLKEMSAGDMVVVAGESDEFYAIQPPSDIKGYIFRTFVLDGVVEGNHVNVRMEPDVSAPVISQMNSGERINGAISARDKKWFEIALPETTHFYISKEFVEKVGDAGHLARISKRKMEVTGLLASATQNSQQELQKPFNQINIEPITKDLNIVITKYNDFPEEVAKAKELLATIQTAYLSKKVVHMESNTAGVPVQSYQQYGQPKLSLPALTDKMAAWLPAEDYLYAHWATENSQAPIREFYQQQSQNAITLEGVIEPYSRPISNKPGDYILLNPTTHLAIGYLYSTIVNLQELVGREVTLQVAPRDNHHFAYPAYFVLNADVE